MNIRTTSLLTLAAAGLLALSPLTAGRLQTSCFRARLRARGRPDDQTWRDPQRRGD
jgi:hypothetical protein